jgi:hypothetical protein
MPKWNAEQTRLIDCVRVLNRMLKHLWRNPVKSPEIDARLYKSLPGCLQIGRME